MLHKAQGAAQKAKKAAKPSKSLQAAQAAAAAASAAAAQAAAAAAANKSANIIDEVRVRVWLFIWVPLARFYTPT